MITHDLLEQLEALRVLLNQPHDKINLVEAYNYFLKASGKGKDCSYAIKCRKLFEEKLQEDVVILIKELYKIVNNV
jgi:hypothetical protein